LLIAILFIIRLRHRATYAKYVRISTVSAAAGVSASALFAIIVFGMTDYIWYTASMQLIFWLVLGIGSAVLRIAKKEFDDSLMSHDENLVTLEAEANITIR
jgi:F0F1-type ATP synthase assembly protein I